MLAVSGRTQPGVLPGLQQPWKRQWLRMQICSTHWIIDTVDV